MSKKEVKMVHFRLNFGGFYESIHDSIIEEATARAYNCDDEATGAIDYDKLYDIDINWKDIRVMYCKELCSVLHSDMMYYDYDGLEDIIVHFKGLSSPTYYNYSTDHISAGISDANFRKMKKYFLSDKDFVEYVNYNSKSQEGFISFYEGLDAVIEEDSILLEYIYNYIFANGNYYLEDFSI